MVSVPWEVRHGGALDLLRDMPAGSVQCCVTSPPYWGLRDYGVPGQLGLEPTPEEYVSRMVEVFREVRRVLRDDGTLWLNLGDSYAGNGKAGRADTDHAIGRADGSAGRPSGKTERRDFERIGDGIKPKDLVGIPWRVAFALQADGWWLRSDIIWAKPNPMPESVTDRPTKAHEYLFLFSKSARYYYDAEAIAEPFADGRMGNPGGGGHYVKEAYTGAVAHANPQSGLARGIWNENGLRSGRNRRSVWTIATQPFPGAHFAVMPEALVEPCILAGTSPQACEKCGAPWERDAVRGTVGDTSKERPTYEADGVLNRRTHPGPHHRRSLVPTGWRPTCSCENTGSADCLVLDPFAGSCTVGVVSMRHGRRFIGLELNPAYVGMGRLRIAGPLFAASS